MQLLPIVQRELLVAARQRMTYLSRTLSAGILLPVFALLQNLHAGGGTFAGPHILSILSTIVFVECMLAGIRYTSDSISEERREGTLGLLFLTDLKGADIVLGKVFARGAARGLQPARRISDPRAHRFDRRCHRQPGRRSLPHTSLVYRFLIERGDVHL